MIPIIRRLPAIDAGYSCIFEGMDKRTLVVIGGGAAGFFCAVNAAAMDPSMTVILLEKSSKLLSKVRISGGGRCNVTHACFKVPELAKKYPRGEKFVKKSFGYFNPADTIQWFEKRGVALKAEEDGRMFPVSDDSGSIIDCLLEQARIHGVQVRLNQEVLALEQTANGWKVVTNSGSLPAQAVCVASGGYPKSSQFNWLKTTKHSLEDPVPSLFTFNLPGHSIRSLMGVVVEPVQVKITGTKLVEKGPVLITHWGLSGPAVLKLSAWGARLLAERNWHFTMLVNWVPAYHEQNLLEFIRGFRNEKGAQKLINRNPFGLPQRFWEYLLAEAGAQGNEKWGELPAKEQNKLVKLLCAMELEVKGKTTFKEEFVTAGGIQLAEVNPATMESRLHPGLYFAGEVLDVDGITGGFNFQHAWTSGWLAARSIVKK
ncbi:NAD(P)/FAD-dependent oxidoreductase [Flavihumibacter sp. CACIAM 22H1]|uniref:NAD(P)/FAD-dependent oxidoreductase n=1 Tax=Flavihumibacter sp. CACIAM 22H1 TaxID=1812911 RepID=UPI0025BFE7CA|nr:NAD(P)/FAD-dependent oxidoreductase [Flavihumibacter sp. CACIAM 22H1]